MSLKPPTRAIAHPATTRSQAVVAAIIDGLRDAAITDGGGCGSRKQEAAAHRHASKASKGSIAGRGAASSSCVRIICLLVSYKPLAAHYNPRDATSAVCCPYFCATAKEHCFSIQKSPAVPHVQPGSPAR